MATCDNVNFLIIMVTFYKNVIDAIKYFRMSVNQFLFFINFTI